MCVPYEDPIVLLRDINACITKSVDAAVEENDQSGPWLPAGLMVRIRHVLHRDVHASDEYMNRIDHIAKKLAEAKEVLDPIAADIYARTGSRIEVADVDEEDEA